MGELIDRYFADRQQLRDKSGIPRQILRLSKVLSGHTTEPPIGPIGPSTEANPRFAGSEYPLPGFPERPAASPEQ